MHESGDTPSLTTGPSTTSHFFSWTTFPLKIPVPLCRLEADSRPPRFFSKPSTDDERCKPRYPAAAARGVLSNLEEIHLTHEQDLHMAILLIEYCS